MKWIETMYCQDGQVVLLEYHLDRLCWGLYQNLVSNVPTIRKICKKKIIEYIATLDGSFRVRMLFHPDTLHCEFSSVPFQTSGCNTWKIGIYHQEQKVFSSPWNAKTTERSVYDNASLWAKENQLDDAIILNERGRVVETIIFNIFLLKDQCLFTPPLSDMPVKGVMRSWLMFNSVFPIIEKSLSVDDLENADFILLTNAVRGIQLGQFVK